MFLRDAKTRAIMALGLVSPLLSAQQAPPADVPISLQVEAGTPLRLYLTHKVRYRRNEIVHAKVAEPVWAFDRIVIPAGTPVEGQVAELIPVPKMVRAMTIVQGDFTPLKRAEVRFANARLPDGRSLRLDTIPSAGLATIFVPPSTKPVKKSKTASANKKPVDPNSKSAQIRSFVKQQAITQANARSYGLLDLVRGPNKREWIENFLWGKLPYRPQWYRSGTRFDAVLEKPLDFGQVTMSAANLQHIGVEPVPDTPTLVRLVATVGSGDAHVGDPVTAVLTQPLFSADHHLALPEGTRVSGKVTLAHAARMFHRGGRLRFRFDSVDLPAEAHAVTATPPEAEPALAQLAAAEPGSGSLKVDSEGMAQATESKTRFLRPVIAGLIAAKSLDNDEGKTNASAGANANYSGRALGGFSGFGLLGTLAVYGPKPIGTALGFYGLAWSVYTNVISRGREVTFERNSAIAIRFAPPRQSH